MEESPLFEYVKMKMKLQVTNEIDAKSENIIKIYWVLCKN